MWLRSSVVANQDDAIINFGPTVYSMDGMFSALHLNRAHFHSTDDESVTLDFKNTTWYCEGGMDLVDAAYRGAVLSPSTVGSGPGNTFATFIAPASGTDSPDAIIPPPSPRSDTSEAPSTILVAAIASGCAGAILCCSSWIQAVLTLLLTALGS